MKEWASKPYFLDRDTSFIGPLESAATLGISEEKLLEFIKLPVLMLVFWKLKSISLNLSDSSRMDSRQSNGCATIERCQKTLRPENCQDNSISFFF